MREIDNTNIVQLLPVHRQTWAVYADENAAPEDSCKFYADEVECWAVVENVHECQPWEAPSLYVGETPCARHTAIHGLHLNEMKHFDFNDHDLNFLGYTHTDPNGEKQIWNRASEDHLARRAAWAEAARKRAERKKRPT